MDLIKLKLIIQSVLTDDLLKPEYCKIPNRHKTTGHCYAASEAAFHFLLLNKEKNWLPICGKDSNSITHWWLKNKDTNEIFDVTSEQYTSFGFVPPYDNGKPCPFLTKNPSKRAQKIMERIHGYSF